MYLVDTLGALIIYVTHDCNLSCSYCLNNFNGSKKASKSLDLADNPDYLRKITEFIQNLEQKNIHIAFFGGEPTCRWDTCKEMYYYLLENLKDKELTCIVQTNGTTIPNIIEDLKVMDKLKVSVSMDADKKNHDCYRIFHNGDPSYDGIVDNIKLMLDNGLEDRLNVACCFYPKDSELLADRLISVLDLGVKKIRTTAIKENLMKAEYFDGYLASMRKMADYLVEHPDKSYYKFGQYPVEDRNGLEKTYQDYMNNIGTDACKAGVYRSFINTNGDMYPCSTMMGPQHKLGNIFTGEINTRLSKQFHQFYKANCDGCGMRGGCVMCMYKMYYDNGTAFICSDVMKRFCEIKKQSMNYFFDICKAKGYL